MSRGFTLLEILLVLVIIAILASVAVPRFANLTSDAKYNASRTTLASANAAAQIAFTHHQMHGSTDSDEYPLIRTGADLLAWMEADTLEGYEALEAEGDPDGSDDAALALRGINGYTSIRWVRLEDSLNMARFELDE